MAGWVDGNSPVNENPRACISQPVHSRRNAISMELLRHYVSQPNKRDKTMILNRVSSGKITKKRKKIYVSSVSNSFRWQSLSASLCFLRSRSVPNLNSKRKCSSVLQLSKMNSIDWFELLEKKNYFQWRDAAK